MNTCFLDELIAKGEAKGEVKGMKQMMMNYLKAHFKSVPKKMEKQIMAMTDTIALESLFNNIMRCSSLKEVGELLD